MTPQEEEAGQANTSAQAVVSSTLTRMSLSFLTTSDSSGRNWSMTLKESAEDLEVPITIAVRGGIFGVAAAISHGALDPSDLWWKLSEKILFVRMERLPSRLVLVAQMPVDRNPPHLLPDTIQDALGAVLSAVTFLVREHPEHVRPEPLMVSPTPPANGEGSASPQG